MSQQERPARSLRQGGQRRVYRDWSAAEAALEGGTDALNSGLGDEMDQLIASQAQEMQMIDTLQDEEVEAEVGGSYSAPVQPAASPSPHQQDMAPLKVIVPDAPQSEEPKEKPKVTRMDGRKLQRARRYSELKADDERKKREEAEAAEKAAAEAAKQEASRKAPPDRSAKTRALPQHQTTQLQGNLQDVNKKIEETRENVKSTAEALSENIKEISDKITVKVVGGIQRFSKGLNRFINRVGKDVDPVERETDFEDEPLPTDAPAQPAIKEDAAPLNVPRDPLGHVETVPKVMYADLLKEKVYFQDFKKNPLVESPENLSAEDLQTAFVEAALQDIRRCVKLVRELPDPKEGPYSGLPVAFIFKNVRENDLYFFMHYVLSKPGPFRKKTFKISEAFGTWILKRSAITVVARPFPEVPDIHYLPLYKQNIRFTTRDRKSLILASNKTPEAFEGEFMERAIDEVKNCVPLVENFPPTDKGPYQKRPLKQVFRYVQERDIHFFLHYIQANPDVFQGQNFKFAEAFASWILKRSHETQLP